ncbi:MAG: glycosyltransferase [Betaproteobacteria bacterium]
MRILNVIPSVDPTRGGTVEGLRQSIGAMAALGHVDEVLSLDDADAEWVRTFPARVHALGPVRSHYGYSAALVPWLKQHAGAYDAVVVHGVWQYHSLAVWRALRRGPVPYFVYFHGMLDPWFRRAYPLKHLKKWLYWPWADYRVARDAKAVLFTALEEQRLAAQSFWLYRVTPAVVGYGLACDGASGAAQADAFGAAFPATRGKRVVLFLARLHEKKGCDLMIEAFARHARVDADAHLVMAGPDQAGMRARLEAQAATLGVADRITWTGMLQGDLKWGALRAADVFALPSHQENFGIAVVEALATGLPVLISERVNIWREVVADDAGFAAPDSADGMAAMLARWHALAPAARDAMRAHATACYERHFRMEAAARRLIETITPHLRPA